MRRRECKWIIWSTLALLLLSNVTRAEALLRWKLQPGERLRYEFRQASRTETSGAGKPTTVVLDMTMQLTWIVDQVDAQGMAALTQTIDKLAVTMKVDELPPIVYDSSSRAPASGPAKEIADSVGGMIGGQCTVTMSGRGEITSVVPSAPLKEAWEKSKAGSLFTNDGLARIVRQASIQLPENPLAAGTMWESNYDSPSPLGNLQMTNRYTYAGPEQQNGSTWDKITVVTSIALTPSQPTAGTAATLDESDQSGTLWFDAAAGRFRRSQLEQRLVTQRRYREMTIRVRSSSSMEMKLVE